MRGVSCALGVVIASDSRLLKLAFAPRPAGDPNSPVSAEASVMHLYTPSDIVDSLDVRGEQQNPGAVIRTVYVEHLILS